MEISEDDKMLAGLCYLFWWLVSWIVLISPKRNLPYLKFHALQSIFSGALVTLLYAMLWIVFLVITHSVPGTDFTSGVMLGLGFLGLIFVGCIIFSIFFYFAYRAWQGSPFRLPFLGSIAARMAEGYDLPLL